MLLADKLFSVTTHSAYYTNNINKWQYFKKSKETVDGIHGISSPTPCCHTLFTDLYPSSHTVTLRHTPFTDLYPSSHTVTLRHTLFTACPSSLPSRSQLSLTALITTPSWIGGECEDEVTAPVWVRQLPGNMADSVECLFFLRQIRRHRWRHRRHPPPWKPSAQPLHVPQQQQARLNDLRKRAEIVKLLTMYIGLQCILL